VALVCLCADAFDARGTDGTKLRVLRAGGVLVRVSTEVAILITNYMVNLNRCREDQIEEVAKRMASHPIPRAAPDSAKANSQSELHPEKYQKTATPFSKIELKKITNNKKKTRKSEYFMVPPQRHHQRSPLDAAILSDPDSYVRPANYPAPIAGDEWTNPTNYSIRFNGSNEWVVCSPGGSVIEDGLKSCNAAKRKVDIMVGVSINEALTKSSWEVKQAKKVWAKEDCR
jgi:hypothetical protein